MIVLKIFEMVGIFIEFKYYLVDKLVVKVEEKIRWL